jgi:hypothetical protein
MTIVLDVIETNERLRQAIFATPILEAMCQVVGEVEPEIANWFFSSLSCFFDGLDEANIPLCLARCDFHTSGNGIDDIEECVDAFLSIYMPVQALVCI